jgi:hypothetical protein
MRRLALVLVLAACSRSSSNDKPDASVQVDAPKAIDAAVDGPQSDGIAEARAQLDGTGLSLAIREVTVTYLKPQIGNATNDPAGFTIQAKQAGLALFVSVDPATLTPPAAVGDVVSFTITTMGTVGMQRRAQAITNYTRVSTGANVGALATDVTAATDLVTNIGAYDSKLVNVTATAFEAFAASGQGFQKAGISTTGVTGDTNLQLRAPATLVDSIDLAMSCTIAAHNVPVGRFNSQVQIGAFNAGELTLTTCPAPVVTQVTPLSTTSVRFTFSRNIKPSSVMANGSQFTFDNGLTASAAAVSARTVTVMTSAQSGTATYTATIANTMTDLQGTALAAGTPSFAGYVQAAMVRINEVNANVNNGCDAIELRVIADGSMAGFKLTERTGNAGNSELSFTFPPGFMVQKNDFVIVHTSSGVAGCNPGTATAETTAKNEQPAATFANNFDTAFDFWSSDNGLTSTDNVFTLVDATNAIVDVLFASDDPAGATAATGTETAAAAAGAANQWSPAMATYVDAVFRMHAADDLNATGTALAGNSIQRVNDADTNAKADWTTGAGVTATWGALNPGQAAL